jgi:hypothetical protein
MLIASSQKTTYLNLWIMLKFDEVQGLSGLNRNYFMQVTKRILRGCECVVGDIVAVGYAQM